MRRRRGLRRSGSLRRTPIRTARRIRPLGRRGQERAERMRERWEELRQEYPAGVPCAFPGCLALAADLHHRLPRSRGGDESEENLAPVCRPHHDWIETHPEAARRDGWTLRSGAQ